MTGAASVEESGIGASAAADSAGLGSAAGASAGVDSTGLDSDLEASSQGREKPPFAFFPFSVLFLP